MKALHIGRARALFNAYRHLEDMLLLRLWCVELSWGLVGGDGQLTSGHAAERATWLVWAVVAGTGVDISNCRSQLPINASVASSQVASSLLRESIFVQLQQLSNSLRLLSSSSLCV